MKRTGFKVKQRKPMPRRASKPKARKTATGPIQDAAYLDRVRARPCCACGASGPSDAHHCKDTPPFDLRGLYVYLPGYGQTSADRDAIPLCRADHDLFHRDHGEFARRYGPDYAFIAGTRAECA